MTSLHAWTQHQRPDLDFHKPVWSSPPPTRLYYRPGSHCTTCTCAVHEPPACLELIEDRIRTLRAELDRLAVERNAFAPINRLPPEILISIFRYSLPEPSADNCIVVEVLRLSAVCTRWRELAQNEPLLWTTLLNPRGEMLWPVLKNSQNLPLSIIYVDATSSWSGTSDDQVMCPAADDIDDTPLACFDAVLSHLFRIQELRLDLETDHMVHVVQKMQNGDAAALKTLDMIVNAETFPCVLDDWRLFAPHLQRFILHNMDGFYSFTHVAALTYFLLRFPHLQYLKLRHPLRFRPIPNPSTVVHLPRLRHLALKDKLEYLAPLISLIDAPNVRHVRITARQGSIYNSDDVDVLARTLERIVRRAVTRDPTNHRRLFLDYIYDENLDVDVQFRMCSPPPPDIRDSILRLLRIRCHPFTSRQRIRQLKDDADHQTLIRVRARECNTAAFMIHESVQRLFRAMEPHELLLEADNVIPDQVMAINVAIANCPTIHTIRVFGISPEHLKILCMIQDGTINLRSFRTLVVDSARFTDEVVFTLRDALANYELNTLHLIYSGGIQPRDLQILRQVACNVTWDGGWRSEGILTKE